jgi:hypothetical protein
MFTGSITGQGYSIMNQPVSPSIAPGDSYTYDVQYSASTMSLQAGTLRVVPTTPGIGDMIITLEGTGGNSVLAATNTNVSTAPNTPVDFDVTVTNSGNYDWSVGTPVVSGSEFALKSSPASVAGSNGTGIFTFTFTPAPGDVQHTATVGFPNSDNTTFTFTLNGTVGTKDVSPTAVNGYELRQNYPNPFAGQSALTFVMAEAGHARIAITSVTGSVVAVIADGFFGKGENTVMFDGSSLPSGSYLYELTAGSTHLQRAMTLRK